jgi:hypothetical protein
MSDAAHRTALIDFQVDFERAIADLEAAIDNIVGIDADAEDEMILVEGDDGVVRVDATELKSLLNRLADAPGAVTGVFEDFGWEIRQALRSLRQALVCETAEG